MDGKDVDMNLAPLPVGPAHFGGITVLKGLAYLVNSGLN